MRISYRAYYDDETIFYTDCHGLSQLSYWKMVVKDQDQLDLVLAMQMIEGYSFPVSVVAEPDLPSQLMIEIVED